MTLQFSILLTSSSTMDSPVYDHKNKWKCFFETLNDDGSWEEECEDDVPDDYYDKSNNVRVYFDTKENALKYMVEYIAYYNTQHSSPVDELENAFAFAFKDIDKMIVYTDDEFRVRLENIDRLLSKPAIKK